MRPIAAFGTIVVLLAAGCVGSGKERPEFDRIATEAELAALPLLDGVHDGSPAGHYDAALHRGSYNVETVGYHNGVDGSSDPDRIPAGGYFTEIDIQEGYAYLARNSVDGSFGGFSIVDVREPESPRLVGTYAGPGAADIDLSDDGSLAFLSAQRNTIEQVVQGATVSQDAGPALARGIHVVDVSDRTAPVRKGFFPLPYNGPHTSTYHRHADGNEYVIVCTYDFIANTVPSSNAPGLPVPTQIVPGTQRVLILRLVETDAAAALVQVGEFRINTPAPAGKLYFPHDTWVERQGDNGTTLLYVSYWDKGLQIVDISNPMSPEPVSGFTEFSPSSLNAIHFSRPFDAPIDGRHVTVTEPEIVAANETGQITFLDTTDPADPQPLGHWRLPPGPAGYLEVNGLDFSPHNFDLVDGKVVLAHYHAGLWVIDASDGENLAQPKTVGFTMDVRERRDNTRMQPQFWGVQEDGGLIYGSDEGTGLYIYRYTGP